MTEKKLKCPFFGILCYDDNFFLITLTPLGYSQTPANIFLLYAKMRLLQQKVDIARFGVKTINFCHVIWAQKWLKIWLLWEWHEIFVILERKIFPLICSDHDPVIESIVPANHLITLSVPYGWDWRTNWTETRSKNKHRTELF